MLRFSEVHKTIFFKAPTGGKRVKCSHKSTVETK